MNENLRKNVYYDARGRRTQAEPNTRRYLFEKGNDVGLRKTEPGMVELLRDSPSGLCCVESFDVDPINVTNSLMNGDKMGAHVEIKAEFGQGNGCDPTCCDYRQEVKAKIFKNSVYDTLGNCGILDSTKYVSDCYGRDCNNSHETYNDALGTYETTDFPGLRNVKKGDTVNVKMEFNSHIIDICPNPYYIKETRYWGFHIWGKVPEAPDSLNTTLFGEINQ